VVITLKFRKSGEVKVAKNRGGVKGLRNKRRAKIRKKAELARKEREERQRRREEREDAYMDEYRDYAASKRG